MALTIKQAEATALLHAQMANTVQVIVADPPYGIAYHSNHYKEKNPHAPIAGDWNFQVTVFLNAASHALRDGGALYLFTRWDVYPLWAANIPPPFKLSNCIIWGKDNWSAGDLEGNFGNQYEMLMFLTKGRHKRRGHRYSNIWNFSRVPSKQLLQPAQKPIGLVERAIRASSDEGDLIADPFCGSGTTGEAAFNSGRDALLGDIDPAMIRITCKRLGLPIPDGVKEVEPVPTCPVFEVQPPAPCLWGLHPEDLAYALDRESSAPASSGLDDAKFLPGMNTGVSFGGKR